MSSATVIVAGNGELWFQPVAVEWWIVREPDGVWTAFRDEARANAFVEFIRLRWPPRRIKAEPVGSLPG